MSELGRFTSSSEEVSILGRRPVSAVFKCSKQGQERGRRPGLHSTQIINIKPIRSGMNHEPAKETGMRGSPSRPSPNRAKRRMKSSRNKSLATRAAGVRV